MSNLNSIKDEIIREKDGSINYNYYDNQARNIRSGSISSLFIRLFTGKEISSVNKSVACDIVDFRHSNERSNQINSVDEAV